MLTYKHLLPKGIVGRKDGRSNELLTKRSRSRKSRANVKVASTATTPGIEYAKSLGLLGAPLSKVGSDPVTKQFLAESAFLPRQAQGLNEREFPLRSQMSFPEGPSTLRISKSETLGMGGLNYSPLKLTRVFGRTDNIPVFNLTGIHKSHIAYAASNVVVIFDYYHNHQSILQGHKNTITCMAKDRENRYLASGDIGKESLVIIWDIRTGYPFKRIVASYEDYGTDSIGFVGVEDYIGTIGTEKVQVEEAGSAPRKQSIMEERQVVKIWFFGSPITAKNKQRLKTPLGKPVVTATIPASVDRQREIVFNDEIPEYFMTCGDKSLVFYTWIRNESRIIHHIPKTPKKFMTRMKGFSMSIWVTGDRCFTCTLAGFVLEFGVITPLGLQEPPNPNHNIKEYRRSYKVGDVPLSAITAYKEFFVVGDYQGNVQFFDEKFRIVRWTKTIYSFPINYISFNITETQPEWKVEMQSQYEAVPGQRMHAQRDGISSVRDYTCGGEKYKQPSQTTIEKPPLFASDLVVGYAGGNTYYYHLGESKVDQLINGTFGQVVALDTCPFTTHVTLCNKKGEIQMYDYMTQALIYSGQLFKKKLTITYLKFHPSGSFALFGTSAGHLYFRRSYTWKAIDSPLEFGQSPIEKIVFSDDGINVSHYDVLFTITLYQFHQRRTLWLPKGKCRAHCRRVVDLSFFKDPTSGDQRLFSLGQDRRFIEYDIAMSTPDTGLAVMSITYVDQCCIPTSMVFEYPWPKHGPMTMIANNINKIKMFDQNIRKTRRTVQGPNYGTSINRMISIAPEASKGRNSAFILMLLGNKIGLMKTPVDGNPFKFMAVLGHGYSHDITEVVVGCNGREVFTCADNDNCVFMWQANVPALETCVLSGGSGIRPYKEMLDAGLPPDKSIAEDVENVFYHMMLKRSLSQQSMLNMNLTILISDIPTVMRTCGFFPSEFEIDGILEEAEFMGGMKLGEKPTEISLDDFIVLFANHRTFPVSDDDVNRVFQLLGMINEEDEMTIGQHEFINSLTTKGEVFNILDLPSFLPTFYRSKEEIVDEQQPLWLKQIQEERKASNQSVTGTALASNSVMEGLNLNSQTGSTHEPDGSTAKDTVKKYEKPAINPKVAVITMTASLNSLLESEDANGSEGPFFMSSHSSTSFDSNQEMPEEISASFFIKELLTPESRDTINWKQARANEEDNLNKLQETTKEVDSWEVILDRWRGRDEWRYFNRIFDQFHRQDIPMEQKLEAAIEMDHYCRTGAWPLPRVARSSMEEEGESETAGGTEEEPGESREAEERSRLGSAESGDGTTDAESYTPRTKKQSAWDAGSRKPDSKKFTKAYAGEREGEGGLEEEGEGYETNSSTPTTEEEPVGEPPKVVSWLNFDNDEDVADEDVADQDVADQDVVDQDVADQDVADVADADVADQDVADQDVANEDEEDGESPPFSNLPITPASPPAEFGEELPTD